MKGRFWKKTAAGLLALILVTGSLPANTPVQDFFSGAVLTAHAAAETASGFCGASTNEGGEESVTWALDDEGTLTISGSGEITTIILKTTTTHSQSTTAQLPLTENVNAQ